MIAAMEIDRRWYQTLFETEDWSLFTADQLTEEYRAHTVAQVDFAERVLGISPGDAVLDVACGAGRHAIELARRGYRVTGVDISTASLARATALADAAGVDVRWLHADMREIPYAGEFNAAINMWTAFGYLENEAEDQRAMDAIARALAPGGALLLDLLNPTGLARNWKAQGWEDLPDGTVLAEERIFDPVTYRIANTWHFLHPDGRRSAESFETRLYTMPELRSMMGRAGLVVDAVFGDFNGAPLTMDTYRMIAIARACGSDEPRPVS